jgi:hypothetical protein
MKIKFISQRTVSLNCKCSLTTYGLLKFNNECTDYMGLKEGNTYMIGIEDNNKPDASKMYLAESNSGEQDGDSIKLKKAGNQFTLNISEICILLKIDYKSFLNNYRVERGSSKYNKMEYYCLTLISSNPRKKYAKE